MEHLLGSDRDTNKEELDVITFSYWSNKKTLFFEQKVNSKFSGELTRKIVSKFAHLDKEFKRLGRLSKKDPMLEKSAIFDWIQNIFSDDLRETVVNKDSVYDSSSL